MWRVEDKPVVQRELNVCLIIKFKSRYRGLTTCIQWLHVHYITLRHFPTVTVFKILWWRYPDASSEVLNKALQYRPKTVSSALLQCSQMPIRSGGEQPGMCAYICTCITCTCTVLSLFFHRPACIDTVIVGYIYMQTYRRYMMPMHISM